MLTGPDLRHVAQRDHNGYPMLFVHEEAERLAQRKVWASRTCAMRACARLQPFVAKRVPSQVREGVSSVLLQRMAQLRAFFSPGQVR